MIKYYLFLLSFPLFAQAAIEQYEVGLLKKWQRRGVQAKNYPQVCLNAHRRKIFCDCNEAYALFQQTQVQMNISSGDTLLASPTVIINEGKESMISEMRANGEGYYAKVIAKKALGQKDKIHVSFALTQIDQNKDIKKSQSELIVANGIATEWRGPGRGNERLTVKLTAKKIN